MFHTGKSQYLSGYRGSAPFQPQVTMRQNTA